MAFVKGMLDSAALFWLILSALTLVIIGMFLMAYMMLVGDRGKRREPVGEKKCAHFFGYLSSYRGLQSIPEECFGCMLAINCIKAKRGMEESGGENRSVVAEPISAIA